MAQAASPSSSKTITLKAADGEIYEVEMSIAKEMKTVQSFIDDDAKASVISLAKVSSQDLVTIIEYCKQRRTALNAKDFDAEFMKDLNNKELLSLIVAVDYLNMKDLFHFLTKYIADRMQNKSVEYLRNMLGITNTGFTEEEEASNREAYPWAFEGGVDTKMNKN